MEGMATAVTKTSLDEAKRRLVLNTAEGHTEEFPWVWLRYHLDMTSEYMQECVWYLGQKGGMIQEYKGASLIALALVGKSPPPVLAQIERVSLVLGGESQHGKNQIPPPNLKGQSQFLTPCFWMLELKRRV